MIRLFMAVPVVSWILFAVLWFPGVEFRIGFVLVVVAARCSWSMRSTPCAACRANCAT